jgi:hypothetical protein
VLPEYFAVPAPSGLEIPTHLKIPAIAIFQNDQRVHLKILIYTGSEINIIKRGLVSPDLFRLSSKPVRLLTASGSILSGGDYEVRSALNINGRAVNTNTPASVNFDTTFYEANIAVDAILSYKWLSTFNVDISSQAHGITINSVTPSVWVKGIKNQPNHVSFNVPSKVHVVEAIDTTQMGPSQLIKKSKLRPRHLNSDFEIPEPPEFPRVLDLFSGGGSVTKAFQNAGYEVTSLDCEPKCKPTFLTNILFWDYKNAFQPQQV